MKETANNRRGITSITIIITIMFTTMLAIFPLKIPNVEASPNTLFGDNFEAYFVAKPAGNLSWGPYKRLSITPTNTTVTTIANNPDYDPDYIVAAFKDNISGDFDWYFSISFDGGFSWTPREIAVDVDYDVSPTVRGCSMAMDTNGTAHFVWHRGKYSSGETTGIYYTNYNGTNWSNPITITEVTGPTTLWIGSPTIIVGRNNILHLSYGTDQPGHDNGCIVYTRSLDGGLSWSIPIDINTFSGLDTGHKAGLCADNNGNVYIAFGPDWYSFGYLGETFFRRSQDDGVTWGTQKIITKGQYSDGHLSINCDNFGGVYLVYKGTRIGASSESNMTDILYKYSLDYGNTWIPDEEGYYLETTTGRYYHQLSALNGSDFIHIIFDNLTQSGIHEGYYMMINTTGSIIVPKTMITPNDSYHSIIRSLAAYGDRVYVGFDNWVVKPLVTELYIRAVGDDIVLNWTQPRKTGLLHYLLYRSTSQTGFNFSNVWVNTSLHNDSGIIPLRTTWNDTGAASGAAPREYYYTIRTVLESGEISSSSRIVGKWTKIFYQGVSTFSLPLEPLQTLWTDNLTTDMNADYIKYMDNDSHVWRQHNFGGGNTNNTQMKLGEGCEVKFSVQTNYTFTGMPGAMIIYDDDSGFSGFNPDSEAKNLTVSVDADGNVTLTWQEPGSMRAGDWYEVYYSNTRDGFFGILNDHYFPVCPPVYFGNSTATHVNAQANNPGARLYYMVVPFNASGVRGASTYSIGIWTEEYLLEYDTIGIPLKLSINQTADWYCDNIPDTVGINYYNISAQRWCWHSKRMSSGAYDPLLEMTEGYQISTSDAAKFTFIGV